MKSQMKSQMRPWNLFYLKKALWIIFFWTKVRNERHAEHYVNNDSIYVLIDLTQFNLLLPFEIKLLARIVIQRSVEEVVIQSAGTSGSGLFNSHLFRNVRFRSDTILEAPLFGLASCRYFVQVKAGTYCHELEIFVVNPVANNPVDFGRRYYHTRSPVDYDFDVSLDKSIYSIHDTIHVAFRLKSISRVQGVRLEFLCEVQRLEFNRNPFVGKRLVADIICPLENPDRNIFLEGRFSINCRALDLHPTVDDVYDMFQIGYSLVFFRMNGGSFMPETELLKLEVDLYRN